MNRLKDFLYDKSDILIALMILLIAGLLIAWRLNAIVEYPKSLVNETSHTEQNAVQGSIFDEPAAENSGEATEGEGENEGEGEGETTEDEPATQEPNANSSKAVWNGGVLAQDVTVTIGEGIAASSMVNDYLVSAGLFESYDDFKQTCEYQGKNPEQIIRGTFTFKAGTSKGDIAVRVTAG